MSTVSTVRESLPDTLRGCAQRVEQCRQAPVAEAKETFGAAMREVIGARNGWLQSEPAAARNATLRRLNALLSLMSNIEFPLSGFHRERIEAVTKEMRAIAESRQS